MNKLARIGPHIIGGVARHLDLLRRWQPALITVLDPNRDEMKELRQACRDTAIVGRIYVPDGEMRDRILANPIDAAHWAHDRMLARWAPEVTYWQIANEICQNWDELDKLVDFERERMACAEQMDWPTRCAILAFSVGNPDMPEHDRMAYWRKCYPIMLHAAQRGHVACVHQYSWPTLWAKDPDWFIHRLEHQVLPQLPVTLASLKFAVTEIGDDGLLDLPEPAGWQKAQTAQQYAQDLIHIGEYLEQYADRVLGYSVFTLGQGHPWESYSIDGEVAEMLAAYYERARADGAPSEDGERGSTVPAGKETTRVNESPVLRATVIRTSAGAQALRISTEPQTGGGLSQYEVVDIFTTANGSWEVPGDLQTADICSIEQWARDRYLKPYGAPDYFDDAGADHHLFARVEDVDGNPLPVEIRFGSEADWSNAVTRRTDEKQSGWANIPIFGGGSSFDPGRGEHGPWRWGPSGGPYVTGGGLPLNHHVSTFAVWRVCREPVPDPEPETDAGVVLVRQQLQIIRNAADKIEATITRR